MLSVSGDNRQKIPPGDKQDQWHAGYRREKERVGQIIFLNQTPLIAHRQPIFQSSPVTQSMEQDSLAPLMVQEKPCPSLAPLNYLYCSKTKQY